MKRNPLIFIQHIFNAITDIESSIKNISKKEFEDNKDVKDATIRRLEIIGEAAKNLPVSFKSKYVRLPWKEMAGTRDKIIHHYFGIDLDIVWNIIKNELPKLKEQIKEILEK